MDPTGTRSRIPLSVRYMWALRKLLRGEALRSFHIFDFHRIEPIGLMLSDPRPKNVVLHQDMSVIRDKDSDIMWRHWPQLYEFVERRLFSRVDHIYTVRQSAVTRYSKLYPGFADKLAFLPTWVDTTLFSPISQSEQLSQARRELRQRLGAREDAHLCVTVGRLDHQKDPLRLIEAFGLVANERADVHLAIVGDGELRAKVEAAISSQALKQRVSLLGVQRPVEIARLHRLSDVFMMTSAYEGMPIALLEALATGLPTVTTDVGEVRLVVSDHVNGRVSADRSPAGIATCLHDVLKNLPRMRGTPCSDAVKPYHATAILSRIYDHHRAQSARQRSVA
jgi:glycosyltransferase involved in cell wall biosynthesis